MESELPPHHVWNTDFCGRLDLLVLGAAFLVRGTAFGGEKVCLGVCLVLGVLLLGLLRFMGIQMSSC